VPLPPGTNPFAVKINNNYNNNNNNNIIITETFWEINDTIFRGRAPCKTKTAVPTTRHGTSRFRHRTNGIFEGKMLRKINWKNWAVA
jgi:hypothetical protein